MSESRPGDETRVAAQSLDRNQHGRWCSLDAVRLAAEGAVLPLSHVGRRRWQWKMALR